MKWFSNIDKITKDASFLSRHVTIHFYCFNQDTSELISNWNVLPEFAEYKTICDKLTLLGTVLGLLLGTALGLELGIVLGNTLGTVLGTELG